MPFDRELIEARLAIDDIPPEEMSRIAWDALEAGLDGPAIRRLAAFEQPTHFEVRDVLPRAMEEMCCARLSVAEGALRLAKRRAGEIVSGREDTRSGVERLAMLWWRTGYLKELAGVGTLDEDAWVMHHRGASDEEIREWLITELKEFISS